jgi:hypothetical protein
MQKMEEFPKRFILKVTMLAKKCIYQQKYARNKANVLEDVINSGEV